MIGIKGNYFSESLKRKINNADIVSFDVFDTLLVRPYTRPTDVFLHIERIFHKPNFCWSRIEAEQLARIRHRELQDVTFDMIYDEIDDVYKDMKQRELDWEEMVLRANPEIKAVYDYAKQAGKTIVIASDMYLPTEFIAKILRKNGYDGWDKLYVSGDINASKHRGHMFKQILNEYGVVPSKMLHIGDNHRSDYKTPKKLHIVTAPYKPIFQQFVESNNRYKMFKTYKHMSLGMSALLGVMAYKYILNKVCPQKTDYWTELGYEYAGPVGYTYMRFVEQVVKDNNIDGLLFVARDGWLLQKIYETFSTKTKNAYVYAPRFINHICRLDYVKNDKKQAQAIIDFYREKYPDNEKLSASFDNPCDFIRQNQDVFVPLANEQMAKYKDYLHHIVPNAKKYALVDTMTVHFSAQKLLQSAIDKDVSGIYWGILRNYHADEYAFKSFVGVCLPSDVIPEYKFFTHNWYFVEFLICSPEYPILSIDEYNRPNYFVSKNSYESRRVELFPQIESGALQFVSDINEWFGGNNIYLSNKDIISWIDGYVQSPTKQDINNMMDIHFDEDSIHQQWVPLFIKKISFVDFLKHPKRTTKTIRSLVWHTPFQSFLLCLYKPITLHTRGWKKISIAIFPCLKKRYVTVSFGSEQRNHFKFVIGNIEGDK